MHVVCISRKVNRYSMATESGGVQALCSMKSNQKDRLSKPCRRLSRDHPCNSPPALHEHLQSPAGNIHSISPPHTISSLPELLYESPLACLVSVMAGRTHHSFCALVHEAILLLDFMGFGMCSITCDPYHCNIVHACPPLLTNTANEAISIDWFSRGRI